MRRISTILAALAALPSMALAQPDLAKMTPVEVGVLTRAMPKGGELHLHLSGAVFGESFLAWARDNGACIDREALALVAPPCDAAHPPATTALEDDWTLYRALLDSFSVRLPGFRGRSGHDQFFGAFARFGPAMARHNGEALAEVMVRAAAQNTYYLELMATGAPGAEELAAALPGTTADLPALKAQMTPQTLAPLVKRAIDEADAMEARARQIMGCGGPAPDRGCQVTVRYLLSGQRRADPKVAFVQLMVGAQLVRSDRRWVGLQMLTPEDEPQALAGYATVSKIVDLVSDHGRSTPVALHAGELTLALAPPEALRDHVAQAVRISGARRIGHGTDVAQEDGADALAAQMARDKVLVEVNLSSNQSILEVGPDRHPFRWLIAKGVPVSLSTDDPGITRTDLSNEYALAATAYGATYADLVTSARNALAFSFLSGAPLWEDPNLYRRPVAVCAGQVGREAPSGGCAALVAGSDKAREQWRYEALLRRFEQSLPAPKP